MAKKKGVGPAPLDPEVARKLLDLLATDNDFRRLFKKDANAALLKVGYRPGTSVSGGQCLQLKAGDRIAPKAKIRRDRARLEQEFAMIWGFAISKGFKAD